MKGRTSAPGAQATALIQVTRCKISAVAGTGISVLNIPRALARYQQVIRPLIRTCLTKFGMRIIPKGPYGTITPEAKSDSICSSACSASGPPRSTVIRYLRHRHLPCLQLGLAYIWICWASHGVLLDDGTSKPKHDPGKEGSRLSTAVHLARDCG